MNELTVTHEVHKLKIPLLDLTNLPPDSDEEKNNATDKDSNDNELIEHRDICLADELGQANDMQMHHMDAFNKVNNHMRDSMPHQYQMRDNFMQNARQSNVDNSIISGNSQSQIN